MHKQASIYILMKFCLAIMAFSHMPLSASRKKKQNSQQTTASPESVKRIAKQRVLSAAKENAALKRVIVEKDAEIQRQRTAIQQYESLSTGKSEAIATLKSVTAALKNQIDFLETETKELNKEIAKLKRERSRALEDLFTKKLLLDSIYNANFFYNTQAHIAKERAFENAVQESFKALDKLKEALNYHED